MLLQKGIGNILLNGNLSFVDIWIQCLSNLYLKSGQKLLTDYIWGYPNRVNWDIKLKCLHQLNLYICQKYDVFVLHCEF